MIVVKEVVSMATLLSRAERSGYITEGERRDIEKNGIESASYGRSQEEMIEHLCSLEDKLKQQLLSKDVHDELERGFNLAHGLGLDAGSRMYYLAIIGRLSAEGSFEELKIYNDRREQKSKA